MSEYVYIIPQQKDKPIKITFEGNYKFEEGEDENGVFLTIRQNITDEIKNNYDVYKINKTEELCFVNKITNKIDFILEKEK